MGILSGSDNSGQKNQRKENRRAQKYMEGQLGRAIDDINRGYDFGDAYRTDTYNMALDNVGRGAYGEMDYYNRGNVAAQQNLVNAMPEYQNALFGMPVNYANFMAVDLGMPNQQDFSARLPEPTAYENYGGVNYEGQPYEQPERTFAQRAQDFGSQLSGQPTGPWARMAYGTPDQPQAQRSFAQKMQGFGDALSGGGQRRMEMENMSNIIRALGIR